MHSFFLWLETDPVWYGVIGAMIVFLAGSQVERMAMNAKKYARQK